MTVLQGSGWAEVCIQQIKALAAERKRLGLTKLLVKGNAFYELLPECMKEDKYLHLWPKAQEHLTKEFRKVIEHPISLRVLWNEHGPAYSLFCFDWEVVQYTKEKPMNVFLEARKAGLAEAQKAEEKWLQNLLDSGWISASMKLICDEIKKGCKEDTSGTSIAWRRFLDDERYAPRFAAANAKNLTHALMALHEEVGKMNAGNDIIKFEWHISPTRVTTEDSYLKICW
jgi:hypothetical protein